MSLLYLSFSQNFLIKMLDGYNDRSKACLISLKGGKRAQAS